MTFLLIHTIAMAIINIANGFFTYRIFKQLSPGANMKNEELKKIIEDEGNPKYEHQELQHLYSAKGTDNESFGNVFSHQDSISKTEIKENNDSLRANFLFIPEEGEILNKLMFLADYLKGKHKPNEGVEEQVFEDMKWETINEVYCIITIGLPRVKAELIRKYFRRLDTTYSKKDGTYYSKVTEGKLAKEIIDDLICAYPWNDSGIGEPVVAEKPKNPKVGSLEVPVKPKKSNDDELKITIEKLSKSIDKLNDILLGQ